MFIKSYDKLRKILQKSYKVSKIGPLILIKIRGFKQMRYCRLLESGMEMTRATRQIDYVSDSGDKN